LCRQQLFQVITMHALCFDHFGGPEVLEYRRLPDPVPGPGEAVVRTTAIGLNFADIHRRRGTSHLAGEPPYILGYEAAGIIASIGPGAPSDSFHVGDRVAFADSPFANAELVAVPLERLIRLPDDVSEETAAGLLLQGLSAQFLTRDSHPIRAGETVVIHAAAGGVGLLLIQIARQLGARVIGVTSSEVKRAAALQAGAETALLYAQDRKDGVRRCTDRRGADVVYDSVGTTLLESLDVARTGGHVVFYGTAGGKAPPIDPMLLHDGSKRITGGDLWNVLTSATERQRRADELFAWVRTGALVLNIARRFPLAEGAAAHRFLESRQSIGKVLLLPVARER
jgi:NADPH2:quinone reductase